MKAKYMVGTSSYTNEFDVANMNVLDKQLKMPFPLITSVQIFDKRHQQLKQIYVGKEINMQSFRETKFYMNKYDIYYEDFVDLLLKGYKRACLLNYKKYDQILVGIEENDEVVPDYYALKSLMKDLHL